MEEQVRLRPDAVYVQTTSKALSFSEVNQKANCISQWLVEKGAAPNQLIGVVMEKGWEQVVGVLAILKANAAYVPISPTLPKDRIDYMIKHSDVTLVLTQSWLANKMDNLDHIEVLCVDDEMSYASYSEEAPEQLVQPKDLAYVIFTSGSTGTPKGVMINHEGAVNTVIDINERLNVTEHDKILALSNLNFDLSVYDIFGALHIGSTLVIPDDHRALDPIHWYQLVTEYGVTIWNSVPQLMSLLTETIYLSLEKIPKTLRLVIMSGDWIPLSLPNQIREVVDHEEIQIISLGGATEASIWSIYYPIIHVQDEWKSIPYGKPLSNQKMYVLNYQYEHCPTHVTGDIYIGGIGLALGYWKDEEKTSKSFITHPRTGERLYRTGDLGRYLEDGNIEFLGREDSQVKIQGYRIELGEIESVLQLFSGIHKAVVIVHELGNGNKALVTFYVGDSDFTIESIRAYLESKLPSYMVPSQFIQLQDIPLNANGKVDRKALVSHVEAALKEVEKEWIQPSTDMERKLADIWAKWLTLELTSIGVQNNFFELGGDSMQAIRMVTEVQKEFSKTVSLRDFYKDPTIKGIVDLLTKKETVMN